MLCHVQFAICVFFGFSSDSGVSDCNFYAVYRWVGLKWVCFSGSPGWKAQQRSDLQSLWPWQMVPSVPLVTLTVHWPHTHICSEQHSSSLLQGWVMQRHTFTCHKANVLLLLLLLHAWWIFWVVFVFIKKYILWLVAYELLHCTTLPFQWPLLLLFCMWKHFCHDNSEKLWVCTTLPDFLGPQCLSACTMWNLNFSIQPL